MKKRFLAQTIGLFSTLFFVGFTSHAQSAKSSLRMKAKAPPPTSGWENEFALTQSEPIKKEKGKRSTRIGNTLGYKFSDTYSAALDVGGRQLWLDKKPEGEEQPKTFFPEDTYLSLSRADVISTGFAIGLPTSEESREAGRRFTFTFTPTWVYTERGATLALTTDLTYSNNMYETVGDLGEEYNEVYSAWSKLILSGAMSKTWNWRAVGTIYQGWDVEGQPSESYTFSTGPEYKPTKNAKFRLSYTTQDKVYSNNPFLSQDISAVQLTALLSL